MRGESGDVVCVRWNDTLNCGNGGWQTSGCQLTSHTKFDLICTCTDKGTFAILDVRKKESSIYITLLRVCTIEDTSLNRTPFPTPSTTLACISTSEMRTPH